MNFLDIGGIVVNVEHISSFKITKKAKVYHLKLYMLNGRGYDISYENIEHLFYDVKQIEERMNGNK